MQKVICALEHLEFLVQKNDNEQLFVEDLRRTIEHLELEDTKKNNERIRYARDIEEVEEHFKQETKDYLTTIKRLQEENRKLSSSLTAATERDSAFSEEESYIEVDLVNKLQGILEKQRDQIRSLEDSLGSMKVEIEEERMQNEKLSTSNKDLRRKLRQSQSQLHCLVDERAELQVTLQDQQRETALLVKRLGLAAKENEDLVRCTSAEPDMRNKVVYDVEDPARPRFTLAELKDILQERNSLKARVSDLEDELELYRPGTRDSDADSNASDLPVQGPMPYEPEDAPWKKSESSGIRKFFRRVFGSNDTEPMIEPSTNSPSGLPSAIREYSRNLFRDTLWTYKEPPPAYPMYH